MDLYSVFLPLSLTLFTYALYRLATSKAASKAGAGGLRAPPALPSVPLLGSLPFLAGASELHLFLTEKAKRYGNVFALYAGSRYIVVLNGYDIIREAFLGKRSNDFAGRTEMLLEKKISNPETRGITSKSYDENYRTLRRHSVGVLKHFGFGDKRIMETQIHEEFEHLSQFLRSKNQAPFNPTDLINMTTLNVIHSFMFGQRFEPGDPIEVYLRSFIRDTIASFNLLFDIFPFLIHVPPFRQRVAKLRSNLPTWNEFIKQKIIDASHEDAGENFVKSFREKSKHDKDAEEELPFVLRNLLAAGTDTTANQLCWAVVALANHPDVQRRVQAELDAIVPRERLPSMDDKARLPYLEATIHEILRARPVIWFGLPRKTMVDTEVGGCFIPADTMIMINLWSAHMDPAVWPEPDKFRPERFLDEAGNVTNRDDMILFSLGKRSCPGEVLARHELFLFLSGLLQQFSILPPEGQTSVPDKKVIVSLFAPAPFDVRFVPRVI